MTERMTAEEWAERTDLPDWRVLQRRVEATFRAGSYEEAAAFVARVATAASAAGHHPDVALRAPGWVRVALTTHLAHGLTELDAELAATISDLAVHAGLTSEPRAAAGVEIAIDALDIDAVRPFWKALLGYEDDPVHDGDVVDALLDPLRLGPAVWFQQMDAPRVQRNRIHVDVSVPHDEADARVAAAIAAGGRLVRDDEARAFWVLADPEGNEACVCTWQDRG